MTVTGEGIPGDVRKLMDRYDYGIDNDGQIVIYTDVFIDEDEE